MRPHQALPLTLPLPLLPLSNPMIFHPGPTPQHSLLEHHLVDNQGAHASNFSSAITPCTRYVTEPDPETANNSGRTTAAQWLRVLFHDFVTADVARGTGGVDASIGFETARGENKGSAFNDSFTFWRPFVNEFVSMSDLIALATVTTIHQCGGKSIPYHPGRIDALQADPTTGVPEPSTSLEETLSQFARAGFTQPDAIALTACGHTLGSVHHGGFPEVAGPEAVTPNNTNGGIPFDATRGVFDARVVEEYVRSTGGRGGPLVTSFNESSRSDQRLYGSDGNETMRWLYGLGGEGFLEVCVGLLGRVVNTVPAGVGLLRVIEPLGVKLVNVTWDLDGDGEVILRGSVRLWGAPTITNKSITLSFTNGYTTTPTPEPETGSTAFGSTGSEVPGVIQYFPFIVNGSNLLNITSLTVSAAGFDNQTFSIPTMDTPFIVPSLTSSTVSQATVTVAVPMVEMWDNISVSIAVPVTQPLTLAPRTVRDTVSLTSRSSTGRGLVLMQGVYDVGEAVTGAMSLTLVYDGQAVDYLMLDAGVAGW